MLLHLSAVSNENLAISQTRLCSIIAKNNPGISIKLIDNHVIRNWNDSYICPPEERFDLLQLSIDEPKDVCETSEEKNHYDSEKLKLTSQTKPVQVTIPKKNPFEDKYVGLKKKMKCGLYATCIAYIDCKNITIQFEDGTIKENVRSDKFMDGNVGYPKT